MVDELRYLLSGHLGGWPSTLFRQSTIGLMKELAAAGTHSANGLLTPASFDDLKRQTREQILHDVGLGPMTARGPLLAQIPREAAEFVPSSFKFKAWMSLLPGLEQDYLANWRQEFQASGYADTAGPTFVGVVAPADSACFIATHLLHIGISSGYLSRWLDYRAQYDAAPYDLDTIVGELEDRVSHGRGTVAVVVGLSRPPQGEIRSTPGWMNTTATRQWLAQYHHNAPMTLHGGILYESEQWDIDGALLDVARAIHRLRQRAILKSGKAPQFYETVWIAGVNNQRRLPETSQLGRALAPGYELADALLESPTSDDRLEVSIELLTSGLSESGPSAAGILWAALEALLAAPGDPDRIQVSSRAGDVALVALVRSSFQISLGVLFSRCQHEALAQYLQTLDRHDRLAELEIALRRDEHLNLHHRSARVVLSHTRHLLEVERFESQRQELQQTLRGLYRHRNLVLHGGITDGPLLSDILRASIPLVAAVVNRFARATYENAIDPHVFAFEMFSRVESYLVDPRTAVSSFW
jgi:hypothetical protein